MKLQPCLTSTDHSYSTPSPQTAVSSGYGIPCSQNVFLQIKFSLHNVCLEFENASGAEAMVGMSLNLITERPLSPLGKVMPEGTTAFSHLQMHSQLHLLIHHGSDSTTLPRL